MVADAGTLPGSVQTLLAFTAFVVPGFLLRAGYTRSRAVSAEHADLHVLAQAVVGSISVLAVSWWWRGEQVLEWIHHGVLYQHRDRAYVFFVVLLAAPYLLGLLGGWAVNGVSWGYDALRPDDGKPWSRRAALFRLLDIGGVLNGPTLWDDVWDDIGRLGTVLVRVRTTDGGEIVGSYETGAWVDQSPKPHELYLRRLYHLDDDGAWQVVPGSEGVLFRGSAIQFVEFIKPRDADSRTPAGQGAPT